MTDEKIRAAVETAQKAIELSHRVPPEGLKKSKELMTLARAVVELAGKIKNERDKHFEDATFMAKMINSKTKKIYRLEAELAALKEKYRWRRQSEEPAPEGGAEALIKAGGELVIAHAIVLNNDTAFEKVTGRRIYLEYWRPLDLPETEDEAE